MQDLEQALGQFVLYRSVLRRREPDRELYLAVPYSIVQSLFEQPMGEILLQDSVVQILGFDPDAEEIIQWLPEPPTATS